MFVLGVILIGENSYKSLGVEGLTIPFNFPHLQWRIQSVEAKRWKWNNGERKSLDAQRIKIARYQKPGYFSNIELRTHANEKQKQKQKNKGESSLAPRRASPPHFPTHILSQWSNWLCHHTRNIFGFVYLSQLQRAKIEHSPVRFTSSRSRFAENRKSFRNKSWAAKQVAMDW